MLKLGYFVLFSRSVCRAPQKSVSLPFVSHIVYGLVSSFCLHHAKDFPNPNGITKRFSSKQFSFW